MKMLIAIASVAALLAVESANAAQLKSESAAVSFLAVGKPGFLKIRGESKGSGANGKLNVGIKTSTGEFTFPLNQLDTGIELRNEHMKNKYLEVGKYPEAKLTFNELSLGEEDLKRGAKKPFKGMLTLHGVTKEVIGEFTLGGADHKLHATFSVKLADFGIEIPSYMGITVSEKADVDVTSTLSP